MTSLMVRGPKPGDASFEQFSKEEADIFQGLQRRSKKLVERLNQAEDIVCNPADGAMYAFPSVQLPEGAILEAEKRNMSPDALYAMSLLEETGICVVPASGFGQKEGRIGFRTTFLPSDDLMDDAVDKIISHHKSFTAKYSAT